MEENEKIIKEFQGFWESNGFTPSDTSVLSISTFTFNEPAVTSGFNVWKAAASRQTPVAEVVAMQGIAKAKELRWLSNGLVNLPVGTRLFVER